MDQNEIMFRPDGSLRPYAERSALYKQQDAKRAAADKKQQADKAAQTAHYMANRSAIQEAEKRAKELEQRLAVVNQPRPKTLEEQYAADLRERRKELARAATDGERSRLQTRIYQLEDAIEEEKAKRERAERVAAVAADPMLKNAREHAAAFVGTPPDSYEAGNAMGLSVFILRDFEDPKEAAKAIELYWAGVREAEQRAIQRLEATLPDLQTASDVSHDALFQAKKKLDSLRSEEFNDRGLLITPEFANAEHKFDNTPYLPPDKPDSSAPPVDAQP